MAGGIQWHLPSLKQVSADEKTEIPGKPNSNMYPPSLELLQENEDLTQAAILDTCEEGPGALRG